MQLSTFRIKFMCIFDSNIQSRMILVKNKISNLDLYSIQHKKCISIYRVLRLPRKRKLDLCSLNDSTETKVLKEFNENQKVQKKSIIFETFCFNAININYNLNTHEVITSYFSFEKNIHVCLRVQGETKRSLCF